MGTGQHDASTGTDVDARVVRTRNDVLGTAIDVLIDDGWEAVTQPNIARAAGYSKATVYSHWPDRLDLLRDALARFGSMPHHEPTGDLRADLVAELISFRTALTEHRLDRVLAILAERASAVPEIADIRDRFVSDGERPLRDMLAEVATSDELESATMALCGAVLHPVLMHGEAPSDAAIEQAVDVTLRGLGLNR